jgi:hypothetical protein
MGSAEGRHLARIHASFTTCSGGRPHTCGVVADYRDSDLEISQLDFAALTDAAYRPDAAAFGKIAVLRRNGIAVYQADARGGIAPAFCGNATAAALCLLRGDGESESTVFGANAEYKVKASVNGRNVAQTWIVPESQVEERTWRGCRVLVLETLNHYALIAGPLPDGIDAETARRELLGTGLAAKLAVVSANNLEFHNANGRHGAAPQTGLASIALAVRAVPWFADLVAGARTLPTVSESNDGRLAITMPAVAVDLSELPLPVAA